MDELAEQRKKQQEEEFSARQKAAQQVARALSTLMLGETIEITPEASVMAVPGGWLFTQTFKAGIASTYVTQPLPPGGQQQPPQSFAEKLIVP